MEQPTEGAIAKEAKKALLSSNVFAEEGCIYAGFRPVGHYHILQDQTSTAE